MVRRDVYRYTAALGVLSIALLGQASANGITVENPTYFPVKLGDGWGSGGKRPRLVKNCKEDGIVGVRLATVDAHEVQTDEDWSRLFRVTAQMNAKYKGVKVDADLASLRQHSRRRICLTFRVEAVKEFLPVRPAVDLALDADAVKKISGYTNMADLLEDYGFGAVETLTRGGRVEVIYQFTFDSESARKELEGSLRTEMKRFGSAECKLKQLVTSNSKRVEYRLRAVQVGGLVDKDVSGLLTAIDGQAKELVENKQIDKLETVTMRAKLEGILNGITPKTAPVIRFTVAPWFRIDPATIARQNRPALLNWANLSDERADAWLKMFHAYSKGKILLDTCDKLAGNGIPQPLRGKAIVGRKAAAKYLDDLEDHRDQLLQVSSLKDLRNLQAASPQPPAVPFSGEDFVKVGKWGGKAKLGNVRGDGYQNACFIPQPELELLVPNTVEMVHLDLLRYKLNFEKWGGSFEPLRKVPANGDHPALETWICQPGAVGLKTEKIGHDFPMDVNRVNDVTNHIAPSIKDALNKSEILLRLFLAGGLELTLDISPSKVGGP